MFLRIRILFPLLAVMVLLASCNPYQKVLKGEDIKEKYDMAQSYYDSGDFKRALRLFEQIAPKYVGKPQGERVMFFLSNSYYRQKDYQTAAYQFERFTKSYQNSDKLAEASFLGAKSYYKLSPAYSLDQTDTDKALAKLQTFINTYQESQYFAEANIMAQELSQKKEKKAYEIAKQFNKLGKFDLTFLTPAISSFDNFISDYPGSVFREEALYYKFESSTELALNSFSSLQKERFENAKKYHANLMKQFPESEFSERAQKLLDKINKELGKMGAESAATK